MHPVDGGYEVELVGEIASMVRLANGTRKAAPEGADVPDLYRSSVKVVAGGGFEPTTFRL